MIDYKQLVLVRPDISAFMMRAGYGKSSGSPDFDIIRLSPTEFSKQVFLLKKWLKQQEKPEDRVMNFECQSGDGCFSFDKYTRIFNSRLRPDENEELISEGNFIL